MATLPWEKGRTSTAQNSSLPWEREKEEEEQRRQRYSSVMGSFPDLYNPSKQLGSLANSFSPQKAEQNLIQAATSRQSDAEKSPLTKAIRGTQGFFNDLLSPLTSKLPQNDNLTSTVSGLRDYRSGVQRDIASLPAGRFIQGIGDAATLGLTPYAERLMGNADVADAITESKEGRAGNLVGQILLPAGKTKAGASILSNIGRGALGGGVLGTGIEAGELLTGRNDQTLGQRALDIGISAGLGGAGVGLIEGVGKGINALRGVAGKAAQGINELGEVATGGMSSGIKRGKSADVVYSPTLGHIVSGTRKASSTTGAKVDQSYINLVDDIFALKRFDEAAEKELGRALNPSESVYQLAMASRGADQVTKQSLTNKLVDIRGNVRGDSLKGAMKGIKRKDQRGFMDYMLNKHAITRFERGEKVFDTLPDGTKWTPEKGAEIVKSYLAKKPEFEGTEQAFRDFNDNFNQTWLVDTGMLPKAVVDNWQVENPTYIDMQRQFSDLEKIGASGAKANSGLGGQKAPVKRYGKFGSTRKVIDPMESMIMRYDASIKAAKRNQPMQAMYNLVQNNPDAFKGLVTKVDDPPPSLNIKGIDLSNPDSLDQILMTFGDAYEKALRSSRKDLDNVVPVMIDGKPAYLKFENKQLLEAVLDVNPQVLKGVMAAASKIAGFQKAIYTGVNPIFTLTRSIFRDPMSAYVNSKTTNNPFEFFADLVTATNAVFRNKELYQEFKNIGGGYTSPNVGEPRLLNRTQRQLVDSDKKLNGVVQRFGDSLLEGLDKIESIVRVAEYKRARGTGRTLDERLRGLEESQEVAINFKRRGAKTKELEPILLYLNASIQSLDKTVRAFKDQKGATAGKIALAITAPSLLLYSINRNNPDYQKLRDSEKDRFFHIPLGDGKFFRFPIPPELAPFANIPRRLLDQTIGGNDDAWNDFGKTIVETVIPPGVSGAISGAAEDGIPGALFGTFRGTPIVGPSVEAFANKSWLGSPIVPGYLEGASPENQLTDTTSPLSIGLGKITNSSPMKLDYMLTSIGGDYGKIIQEISTKGRSEGVKSVLKGIGKRLVIDSEQSNKLIDQFYDLKDKYDTMYNDIKATKKIPEGYNDDNRKALNQISGFLSDISTAINEAQNAVIPKAEKERVIKQLKQKRMEIAEFAYESLK